ncbi:MAG: hypothetical protein WCO00_06130 [Rhodospirillaceae bacterium]
MAFRVTTETPLNREVLASRFIVTHIEGDTFSPAMAVSDSRKIEKNVTVSIPGIPGKTVIKLADVEFVLDAPEQRDAVIQAFLGLGEEAEKASEKLSHELQVLAEKQVALEAKIDAIHNSVSANFNKRLTEMFPPQAPVAVAA